MKPGKLLLGSCLSALAALISFPSIVAAQGIETVTVTAEKREQSVQDVSAAITAVGGERLQDAHIDNLSDLQTIVPYVYFGNDFNMAKTFVRGVGANTSTTGSETGVALYLDGAFVARAEAQLLSLFDLERVEVARGPQGTLYGRNAVGGAINLITAKPTRDPEGYLRVTYGNFQHIVGEGALSGPLSDTLFARVAFKTENRSGFGVNPVTGHDVDDLSRAMVRGEVNWVPNDKFDVLLTGEFYHQDDASGALHFRRASYPGLVRLKDLGAGGHAVNRRDAASEVDPETQTKSWYVTGTTNWHPTEEITLTNIVNYRELTGFLTQDLDLSAIQNGFSTNGQNSTVQRRDIKSRQFSVEQQVKYDNDWMHGIIGFFYFHEKQDPVDTVGFGPVLGEPNIFKPLSTEVKFPPIGPTGLERDGFFVPFTPIPVNDALDLCNSFDHLGGGIASATPPPPKRVCIRTHLTNFSYAVFGHANINLGKFVPALSAFTIKLGARFSHEHVEATSPSLVVARNGLGPVIVTTLNGNFNERRFDNFSPEAGIEWRPADNLMLYYTYSRAFKAGAGENNQGPVDASVNFRAVIVDPEKIRNHEAGIKSQWFDNRLLVNAAGFTYTLRGQQINKTIAGGAAGFSTIFQNAASTSARGVELDFTALPIENLRIDGSGIWLESKYDDFLTTDPLNPSNVSTAGPCPSPPDPASTCFKPVKVQLAGNPTRDSPKFTLHGHVEYDIRSSAFDHVFGSGAIGRMLNGGYITPTFDITYRTDTFFTEFHRLLEGQPAYTLIDSSLRYTSPEGNLTAEMWVKNLTDKTVAGSTFQLATARVIGVTYLPPRTYGFTLGYKF